MAVLRRTRSLTVLLLLALVAFLVFLLLGGKVDLNYRAPDADVQIQNPDVNVSPGKLPEVNVDPGRLPGVNVNEP